ncbi:hypothetical protein LCGC14_2714170 [marine sediment metagenome]|uniref:Uncharacterized protein n=1 Tax=marine sediment metagenome TaxID=412755 RepID=A0A0F9BL30_9ZZZZ
MRTDYTVRKVQLDRHGYVVGPDSDRVAFSTGLEFYGHTFGGRYGSVLPIIKERTDRDDGEQIIVVKWPGRPPTFIVFKVTGPSKRRSDLGWVRVEALVEFPTRQVK